MNRTKVDTSGLEGTLQDAYNATQTAKRQVLDLENDEVELNHTFEAIERAAQAVLDAFCEISEYHEQATDHKGRN